VARVPAGIASTASSPQRKRSGVGDVPGAGWEKRTIDKKEREPLRWDLAVQEKVNVGRSNLNLIFHFPILIVFGCITFFY
jgi:hypothetical protein